MAEEAIFENLEQHSITSSQSAQDSRECYDLDYDFSFRHPLFEDDSELSYIQSSELAKISKQSHIFNASKHSSSSLHTKQ